MHDTHSKMNSETASEANEPFLRGIATDDEMNIDDSLAQRDSPLRYRKPSVSASLVRESLHSRLTICSSPSPDILAASRILSLKSRHGNGHGP